MRKEIIGNCELYLGDCREVLPTLGRVDAVVIDPPYGIGFKEYESHNDDPETYRDLMRDLLAKSEPLVQDGWMVVFQAAKTCRYWSEMFPRPYRIFSAAKNFTQILPGKGPLWSTDFALFWPIGKPKQEGKGRDFHLAITSDMSNRPKGHPCPRPYDQICFIVECFSDYQQLILDPFMGSGTTGAACAKLGRHFIGIEIEPKYFDLSCRRVEKAYRQPDIFIPRPEIAQEEMSV